MLPEHREPPLPIDRAGSTPREAQEPPPSPYASIAGRLAAYPGERPAPTSEPPRKLQPRPPGCIGHGGA